MFTLFAHRIALGRLFQSFGAAHVNERSPRVVRLLNAGYFNKSVSELVLRLYLPGFFNSISSDRFICQSTFLSYYFSALNIFQGFSLNFARTLGRQLLNGSRVIHTSSLFLESKA